MTSRSGKRAFRRTSIVIATCVAGCVAVATLGPAAGSANAEPPATAAVYALHKSAFGIAPGSGFFRDEAHMRAGLDTFKTLGVRWIRSTIAWRNFEPDDPARLPAGEPAYDWKSVDQLVAMLNAPAYKGRFRLIVTVESPPSWAMAKARVGHIGCLSQAPFDLASYARATAALALRLRGTAAVFEVENSPNIKGVWPAPNPCGYAQLLRLTTASVHALRIGAIVLVGGIGGTTDEPKQEIAADEFLADLYVNGAKGAFDGVSFHPYSTPRLPCAPAAPLCVFDANRTSKDPYGMTNGWDRMLNARRIMVARGDANKLMWITEFGGPTNGPNGSGAVLSEWQQATLLAAGFRRASQYPWVAEMCWFTYQDRAANPQFAPYGDWMGLLRPKGSRKPAFTAYALLARSAR